MQFTRLRLNGFKSFVDSTELVIAEGLTGVVGPNGCGKSNLLEALRWVMGETRAKAMRGGGMEDVIFAGTSSRNARNFAEVTLTIDNSERLAPAAFNEADILEIVRRITRDAGSAYKANTRDVRARDVQMLFADASTGAHSPSLVRQGQISELINAKPRARRRVLEEAAGISGLYQRRHEAELKLKSTSTNLERVEDVVEQLVTQLGQLSRQAKAAARYREIGAELREAEGRHLYVLWRKATAKAEEAQAAQRNAVMDCAQQEKAVRAADAAREEAEAALPDLREEEAIARAVHQRAIVARDLAADKADQAEAALEALASQLAQANSDNDREDQLDRDAERTTDRLRQELAELTEAQDGHDDRIEEAEAALDEAGAMIEAQEAQLQALQGQLAGQQAERDVALRDIARHQAALTKHQTAIARAEEQGEAAIAERDRQLDVVEQARAALEEAQSEQDAAEEQQDQAETAHRDAQDAEAAARQAKAGAQARLGGLAAECDGLRNLLQTGTDERGEGLIAALHVDDDFARALGTVLADDLNIPAQSEGQGSGWVQLPKYGEHQPLPEGVEPLSCHVAPHPLLARRLKQVGIVADAAAGARLHSELRPGQRLVTRDGDVWRWDGLTLAAADAPSAASLRLEQQNRLRKVEADLAAAEEEAETAQAAWMAAEADKSACAEAERAARSGRKAADQQVEAANRAVTLAEAASRTAAAKAEEQTQAIAHHAAQAESEAEGLAEAEQAMEAFDDLEELRDQIYSAKDELTGTRDAVAAARAARDGLRRDGAARDKRLAQISRDLSDWDQRKASAEKRRGDLAARLAGLTSALNEAKAQPDLLRQELDQLTEQAAHAEDRMSAAIEAASAADTLLRQVAGEARAAEKQASKARESLARAETKVESATASVQSAEARIAEERNTTAAELGQELQGVPEDWPDVKSLEAQVSRLRRAREALGAVNLRAEE
ncbi:MAG: chromosome segregation SMC family protein, partial [Mangrovicoccus sp.]